MKRTAYSELYLDDTNLLHEDLFATVARKPIDFEQFLSDYAKSLVRSKIDNGNARFMNMTTDEYMAYLFKEIKTKPGECDIDYLQASWIGIVYNMIQFYTCEPMAELYKKIDYTRIKQLFIPLHTVDYSIAVDKIIKSNKLAGSQ